MFKKKVVIEVDGFELDRLVAKEYGLKSFCGHLESPNDSVYTYSVDGAEFDQWEQKDFDEAIRLGGIEHWQYGIILNDLCRKGKLEPGEYLVEVSW